MNTTNDQRGGTCRVRVNDDYGILFHRVSFVDDAVLAFIERFGFMGHARDARGARRASRPIERR